MVKMKYLLVYILLIMYLVILESSVYNKMINM